MPHPRGVGTSLTFGPHRGVVNLKFEQHIGDVPTLGGWGHHHVPTLGGWGHHQCVVQI